MLANRVRMRLLDVGGELEGYVLATDDDFSGITNSGFKYIGSDLKVVIPNMIKGIAVTRYDSMFTDSSVIGVASYNPNVTHMSSTFTRSQATTLDLSSFDTSNTTHMTYMFYWSNATTLDLSSFDTSNVISMMAMFYGSQATTLDLSSFNTSKVTNMSNMFQNSQATTGYARTQADAKRFNNSSGKPSALVFVVK